MSPKFSPLGQELEAIFDEALESIRAEERARELRGEPPPPARPLPPDLAEAAAALKAIFEGDHNLTADMSFDQVYAKALPHFITVWKHMLREQATGDGQQPPPPAHGDR